MSTSDNSPQDLPNDPMEGLDLPTGWSASAPDEGDAPVIAELLRRHEEAARGWASSGEDDVLVEIGAKGAMVRENLILRDADGVLRGWGSSHDRAAGRMLSISIVDPRLSDEEADQAATALFDWADRCAVKVGRSRELETQQIDAGAFADDPRQHRWLEKAGYRHVRTWWQMSRPVTPEEGDLDPELGEGVRIRPVKREGKGMPDEDDLRTVHDVLESAFADHFNSYEETFDEFIFRLREDPGHRWDHWWIAELMDAGEEAPEAAGALVGTVSEGGEDEDGNPKPDGSYVAYIGVLQSARGRGVAKGLLRTIIADAASRDRNRVGLEVDADSPTGAEGLYLAMGWETTYSTHSWHKDVPVS